MRKIIKNLDKPLLLISFILFTIGLIMIFSASNVTAFMKYSASPYLYFIRQSVVLGVSLVGSLFVLKFSSKGYYYIMTILTIAVAALLVMVFLYGTVKNRSIRWIDIGPVNIQPSEFAKIIVMMWLATFYDKKEKKLNNAFIVFIPLAMAFAIGLGIAAEPDLDTTIIYYLIIASVFFLAPMSKEIRRNTLLIVCGGLIIFLLVFFGSGGNILTPGQKERLLNFGNPCSTEKYYSTGNQVCNGYIAINNGGLTGVGLGNSTQKYLYLPEAHTDFIFAIIMEELGFAGALGIFFLYFLLIGRIIKIGKDSHTTRGFLICMGVACYIILHIVVNLGGMFGVMPTTGVPLPFMSYGGSFCMCLVAGLTFVQRINIENRLLKEHKEKIKKNANA